VFVYWVEAQAGLKSCNRGQPSWWPSLDLVAYFTMPLSPPGDKSPLADFHRLVYQSRAAPQKRRFERNALRARALD
jgi:hypothetical protein